MALYTVYEPSSAAGDVATRAERLVFVKDGFNWPALFVPVLWLLYRRMWIELIVFIALVVGLQSALSLSSFGEAMTGWCVLGLCFLLALEANDLRGRALLRKGFVHAGLASGRSRDEAEYDFLRHWLPSQERATARTEARAMAAAAKLADARPDAMPASDDGEVIGSFPRA